jgi:hypothetical protein
VGLRPHAVELSRGKGEYGERRDRSEKDANAIMARALFKMTAPKSTDDALPWPTTVTSIHKY